MRTFSWVMVAENSLKKRHPIYRTSASSKRENVLLSKDEDDIEIVFEKLISEIYWLKNTNRPGWGADKGCISILFESKAS